MQSHWFGGGWALSMVFACFSTNYRSRSLSKTIKTNNSPYKSHRIENTLLIPCGKLRCMHFVQCKTWHPIRIETNADCRAHRLLRLFLQFLRPTFQRTAARHALTFITLFFSFVIFFFRLATNLFQSRTAHTMNVTFRIHQIDIDHIGKSCLCDTFAPDKQYQTHQTN